MRVSSNSTMAVITFRGHRSRPTTHCCSSSSAPMPRETHCVVRSAALWPLSDRYRRLRVMIASKRLSGSAPSHRDRFSAAFITNIAESRFSARTTQYDLTWVGLAPTTPEAASSWCQGTSWPAAVSRLQDLAHRLGLDWHWLGATRACRLEEHQLTGADGCRSHRQWWRCGSAGRKSWRLRLNRSGKKKAAGGASFWIWLLSCTSC